MAKAKTTTVATRVTKNAPLVPSSTITPIEKPHKLSGKILMDLVTEHPSAKLLRFGEGETPEYKIKKGEENHVHIEWDTMRFNREGAKTSIPEKLITTARMWGFMRKSLLQRGARYIRLLHAPETCNVNLLMAQGVFNDLDNSLEPAFVFPVEVEIIKMEGAETRKQKSRETRAANVKALKDKALNDNQ